MIRMPSLTRGFTLVEMIVVIVLSGIVAGMIASFIRSPVDAYVDAERRARMSAVADTALRRMARDVRAALPNSVRVAVSGGVTYLEYVPVVGAGRYRQQLNSANGGDFLDFTQADTSANVLGPVPVYAAGNSLVVFNLDPGSASDVYAGNNRASLTSGNASTTLISTDAAPHTLTFASRLFPSPSPAARFHIVQTPVTYECNPVTGLLRRHSGYAFTAAQQTPPAASVVATLATRVSSCAIAYNPSALLSRTGLATVMLGLTDSGETANLTMQIHVQNMP